MSMIKASEIFTTEEIEKIRYICKLFNGKVVRIYGREKEIDEKRETNSKKT